MKVACATILSCLMFVTPVRCAFAEAPLAPGKPAGVHKAQLMDGDRGIFLVAGAALIGITVGLATAGNGPSASGTGPGSGGGGTTSTSTTAP